MDQLKTPVKTLVDTVSLGTLVRREVSAYAGEAYGTNGSTWLYYTEDPDDRVYAVLAPYNPVSRKGDLVLMARIVDDQVIIDVDKTGSPLRDALRQAGIPDDQIKLAWDTLTR